MTLTAVDVELLPSVCDEVPAREGDAYAASRGRRLRRNLGGQLRNLPKER